MWCEKYTGLCVHVSEHIFAFQDLKLIIFCFVTIFQSLGNCWIKEIRFIILYLIYTFKNVLVQVVNTRITTNNNLGNKDNCRSIFFFKIIYYIVYTFSVFWLLFHDLGISFFKMIWSFQQAFLAILISLIKTHQEFFYAFPHNDIFF